MGIPLIKIIFSFLENLCEKGPIRGPCQKTTRRPECRKGIISEKRGKSTDEIR